MLLKILLELLYKRTTARFCGKATGRPDRVHQTTPVDNINDISQYFYIIHYISKVSIFWSQYWWEIIFLNATRIWEILMQYTTNLLASPTGLS